MRESLEVIREIKQILPMVSEKKLREWIEEKGLNSLKAKEISDACKLHKTSPYAIVKWNEDLPLSKIWQIFALNQELNDWGLDLTFRASHLLLERCNWNVALVESLIEAFEPAMNEWRHPNSAIKWLMRYVEENLGGDIISAISVLEDNPALFIDQMKGRSEVGQREEY